MTTDTNGREDLIKEIDKLKLDLAAKDEAITELEAREAFFQNEAIYLAGRLAKLGEKKSD